MSETIETAPPWLLPVREPRFAGNPGRRVAYEVGGDPTGPTLLLLHGLGVGRRGWAPQWNDLGRDHQIVAMDIRGHGDSDPIGHAGRMEDHAVDVSTVLDDLVADDVIIVGHSWGSVIAVATAVSDPRITGVVALEPAPLRWNTEVSGFFQMMSEAVQGHQRDLALTQFAQSMFQPHESELADWFTAQLLATDEATVASCFENVPKFDASAHLGETNASVALILGEMPVAVRWSAALDEDHPEVRRAQAIGAGHFPQLTVSEQVNAIIRTCVSLIE